MNRKKKNALFIALLLHCALFQHCFASHLETLEEILRFCSANGHVYIALLDEGSKAYHQNMKSSTHLGSSGAVRSGHSSVCSWTTFRKPPSGSHTEKILG